jgi:hypothetical protein
MTNSQAKIKTCSLPRSHANCCVSQSSNRRGVAGLVRQPSPAHKFRSAVQHCVLTATCSLPHRQTSWLAALSGRRFCTCCWWRCLNLGNMLPDRCSLRIPTSPAAAALGYARTVRKPRVVFHSLELPGTSCCASCRRSNRSPIPPRWAPKEAAGARRARPIHIKRKASEEGIFAGQFVWMEEGRLQAP